MAKARPVKKRKTTAPAKKTKVKPLKKLAKPVKKKAVKTAKRSAAKPVKKKAVKTKTVPVKKMQKSPTKAVKRAASKPRKAPLAPKKKAAQRSPLPPKLAPPKAPAVIQQGLTGAMPLAVVTHFYDRIGVATLKLMGTMRMGDRIRVTRGETSFEQSVHSLQIAGNPVQGALAGQDVAMKLDQPAHEGARVYKA